MLIRNHENILFIIAIILVITTGCTIGNQEEITDENAASVTATHDNGYRKITADEAQRMMEESTEYILLDVRTDEEFKENRIDGAILIPDYELSYRAETELPYWTQKRQCIASIY